MTGKSGTKGGYGQKLLGLAVGSYMRLSPALRARLKAAVSRGLMAFLRKNAGRITARLKKTAVLLWQAMNDPEVPWRAKVLAISALVYLINPFDIICDFLPGGFADDWAALAAGAAAVSAIIAAHREKTEKQGEYHAQR